MTLCPALSVVIFLSTLFNHQLPLVLGADSKKFPTSPDAETIPTSPDAETIPVSPNADTIPASPDVNSIGTEVFVSSGKEVRKVTEDADMIREEGDAEQEEEDHVEELEEELWASRKRSLVQTRTRRNLHDTLLDFSGTGHGRGTVKALKSTEKKEGRRKRESSPTLPGHLWQKQIVPYVFEENESEDDVRNYRYAMAVVEQHTCLTFVPWNSSTKSIYGLDHDGYFKFHKDPSRSSGYAHVGNSHPGQRLNCHSGGNCLHELFHTVGFHHEQKSSKRNGFVRINWENIDPSKLSEYTERSDDGDGKEPYDTSSSLHYSIKTGSKAEMTLLFPELNIQWTNYYQFKEIADTYHCKESFCSDFTMSCDNDGYVTSRHGRCQCMCPKGLDPTTGCSSLLNKVITGPFPGGHYGLSQHKEGCPDGNFLSGYVDHRFIAVVPYKPYTLEGIWEYRGRMVQHFCVMDNPDNAISWPPGTYCIYRRGGACPAGFQNGWVQFDNVYSTTEPTSAQFEGAVPDGDYTENTKLYFCCRQDADPNVPLNLPNIQSFALFPLSGTCQRVVGMAETRNNIYLKVDTADGGYSYSTVKPNIHQNSKGSSHLWVRYCSYLPVNRDCGGIISLSGAKREEFINSPGYSSSYANGLECDWFIKGPEKSTVILTFHDFDIEGSEKKCQDSVEINTYRFGQQGERYCGTHLRKTFTSILNTLRVTLRTGPTGQARGFNATVRVVLEEESCLNSADLGSSYRGSINYTKELKTCLHWSDPALTRHGCYHYASNPLDINSGLDANYCRNPGHGVLPWCYTKAEGCQRSYCDVCQIGELYDTSTDCEALEDADESYCHNITRAVELCAGTCADILPAVQTATPYIAVTCSSPPQPVDGTPVQPLSGSYVMGSTVTFRCVQDSESTWVQTTTCLSDGTWTPIGSVCTGCRDGWFPFNEDCYWASADSATFEEAQTICASLGAEVAEVRDQRTMDFFFHMRDDGLTQWLGLKENGKGNWTWQDGSPPVWTKWRTGNRASNKTNSDYCALFKFTNDWDDSSCSKIHHFACRMLKQEAPPAPFMENCFNKYSDSLCRGWAGAGHCSATKGFMEDNCNKTCGFCPKPCAGSPCGKHTCTVTDSEGNGQCTCDVGHYGSSCQNQFPCVDRASPSYCSSRLQDDASLCSSFSQFSRFLCRQSCANC